MLNNYCCVANLTKDVELRYTGTGTAVATLSLAVNTGFGDKKETCFINATVWKAQAENASKYLQKGSKVAVNGSLKQRSWEDKQGNKRSTIEVNAFAVDYLDAKSDNQGQAPSAIESGFMGNATSNAFEAEEEIVIPGELDMF